MKIPLSLLPALAVWTLVNTAALPAQPSPPDHKANFEAERRQANDLFVAGKILDSLPLYEDLCRQDQTVAVFAERHAAGLLYKGAGLSDPAAATANRQQVIAELRRAQSLGDNSPLLQNIFAMMAKVSGGAVASGVALTPGYTYRGTPAAQASMQKAEAAFTQNDFSTALQLYQRAAALDPAFYEAALDAGDTYFRLKDWVNAGLWFQKAVAIDPDRDTAYRYWGDALYKAGDSAQAKLRYEQGLVAEPYGRTALNSLQQWVTLTKTQVGRVQIVRPEFTTSGGKLQAAPALATETGDGHASWLVYQQARVAHGAPALSQPVVAGVPDANGQLHPSGYRHSLAEETESLTAMLQDVQRKLDAGTITLDRLEPSLKTLRQLQKDGMIESWVLLTAADAGIRYDYPAYRAQHRDLLLAYVDRYILGPPSSVAVSSAQKSAE